MLGTRKYQDVAIDLWQGDITKFTCDAMVNAANERLAGGGGVDGAIHRTGGPSIMEECKKIGGCPTGQAVSTSAGNLPCKWVIHAVGPVWSGGKRNEPELLAQAYRSSLNEGQKLVAEHIAFSALSTGVYHYPLEQAAEIGLSNVRCYLDEVPATSIRRITFVLFNGEIYKVFQDKLFSIFPE